MKGIALLAVALMALLAVRAGSIPAATAAGDEQSPVPEAEEGASDLPDPFEGENCKPPTGHSCVPT